MAHGVICWHITTRACTCRQPNSWLDIQLYCTGTHDKKPSNALHAPNVDFKAPSDTNGHGVKNGALSIEPMAKTNQESFPSLHRPELKLASPFFLKPR